MPPIKTLLLQISVNIIRIQMLFHGLPGISSNVSGILIFLTPMNSCVQSILSLVPKPRTPSCMQRSYLLSIDFKVHSLTDWAAQLKINPLYAILSGFEFGDTPGVGTFYDFLSRLWDSEDSNLSSHCVLQKRKGLKSLLIKVLKPNLSRRFPLFSYWSSWKQPLLH